jgi:non-ribosomal peptide synthetase component F
VKYPPLICWGRNVMEWERGLILASAIGTIESRKSACSRKLWNLVWDYQAIHGIVNSSQVKLKNMPYLLDQLLETSAKRYPDREAVIYKNNAITYQPLDTLSNQLAWVLRDSGIPTAFVG